MYLVMGNPTITLSRCKLRKQLWDFEKDPPPNADNFKEIKHWFMSMYHKIA